MPYCTLEDIKDMMDEAEIIRYTDDYDSGMINTDATDKGIAGADALIDAYIARKYSVPVDPVPDILLGLAVDIAIYKICSRRSLAPDEIRTKYEDAVKFLEKVAMGKASLPNSESAPLSASDHAVTITSSEKLFSRNSLKGF